MWESFIFVKSTVRIQSSNQTELYSENTDFAENGDLHRVYLGIVHCSTIQASVPMTVHVTLVLYRENWEMKNNTVMDWTTCKSPLEHKPSIEMKKKYFYDVIVVIWKKCWFFRCTHGGTLRKNAPRDLILFFFTNGLSIMNKTRILIDSELFLWHLPPVMLFQIPKIVKNLKILTIFDIFWSVYYTHMTLPNTRVVE